MDEEKAGLKMAGKLKPEPKDIVKDIVFFFLTVAGTFGYVLFILMLLSFMFLRFVAFINLEFEHMLVISGVAAGFSAGWYLYKMIKKYNS